MFYYNTLNLIQVGGGTQVKQGDLGSKFSYKLVNEKDQELDDFDKEVAIIDLVLNDKIVFTTTAIVDNSTVTFNIDKAIPVGLYFLEIRIRDYVFPSDKQTIIFVQSGAVPYDLKELVPNYDTNMTIKGILSDLSQKGIDIRDLNRRMEAIYNNALADHAEITTARGGFETLSNRLSDINNQIKNVTSGSPKGVYPNLAALQSAKPNGDSGIYITADNGHWYYYNSGWQDGGVYQASASLNQTTDKVLYSHLDLTKLESWNGLSFKVDENSIIETRNSNENCGLIVDVPATAKYLNMKFIEKNATEVQLYKYDKSASNGVGTILETIKISTGSIYTYKLTEYGTYMFVFKGNGLTNKLKIAASDTKSVDLTDVIEAFDDSLDVSKLSDKVAFGDEVDLGATTAFGEAKLVKTAYTVTAKVSANNGGLSTQQFSAHSNRVVVYTDLTFTQKGITVQISYIDKTDNRRQYKILNKFTGGKVDKVEFDASNLVIYSNADPATFKLLIQSNLDSAVDNDPVGDITLGRLSIFDAGGSDDVTSNPMYEPALKSTLGNIIDKVTEIDSKTQTTDKVLYSHLDLTKLKSWNGLSFKVDENSIIETRNSNENCGLIVDVPATAKYLNMKFIEKNATKVQLYKYDKSAPNGVGTQLEDFDVSAGTIYTYKLTEYGTYMFVFKGRGLTNKLKIAASDTKSVDLTDVIQTIDNSLDVSKLSDKEALGDEIYLGATKSFGEASIKFSGNKAIASVRNNNGGLLTQQFSAHSNRVVVYTDLTFTQKGITVQISYIDKTDNRRQYKTLNKFTGGKVDKVEFDASNLVIYSNADPATFKLLIQANTDSAVGNDPVGDITLGRLSIFDAGGSDDVTSNPMYEPALKSTLGNIIDKLTEIGSDIAELKSRKGSYVTMPDGSEAKLVYVNGVVTVKGSNYNKVLLLGNSILLGFSTDGSHGAPFGCTASDSKHDWAYLLTEKLKAKSPNITVTKLHDAKFEQAESDSASESYISNEFAAAARNNDLVIVQIGDNVNTELRQQTFRNNFSKLIRAIRTNNPAADIVVAGAWFNNRGIQNFLQDQASSLNYTFVPLSDLSTSANMATVGDTVTFNDGVQMQVYEAIRTHPGNKGMEAIANRIYDSLN